MNKTDLQAQCPERYQQFVELANRAKDTKAGYVLLLGNYVKVLILDEATARVLMARDFDYEDFIQVEAAIDAQLERMQDKTSIIDNFMTIATMTGAKLKGTAEELTFYPVSEALPQEINFAATYSNVHAFASKLVEDSIYSD